MNIKMISWFDLRKKLSHHHQLFYVFIIIFTSRKMYGKSQHPLLSLRSFLSFNYTSSYIIYGIRVSVWSTKALVKTLLVWKVDDFLHDTSSSASSWKWFWYRIKLIISRIRKFKVSNLEIKRDAYTVLILDIVVTTFNIIYDYDDLLFFIFKSPNTHNWCKLR